MDQLIFYIYGQQQLKPLPAPNNNISNNSDDGSNNTHIEKLNKLNYLITPGIGAHKLHPRRVGWNKARRACIQEGGKEDNSNNYHALNEHYEHFNLYIALHIVSIKRLR